MELKVFNLIWANFPRLFCVPNLPCGVERIYNLIYRLTDDLPFLIYRVELKDYFAGGRPKIFKTVPNLPCGVERQSIAVYKGRTKCVSS